MKRNLLFAMALSVLFVAPSMAGVTVEESTDAEYLINSGFSQTVAEDVFVQKSRVRGHAIEPLYERSQNKFVVFLRKAYAYIDPAVDEPTERLHHDIKMSPSFSDL